MNPYGITNQPPPVALTGNCAGHWKTFDSVEPLLSAIARDLCDTCPVLLECREQRDTWLASSTTVRAFIEGTWAGRTYGGDERNRRREAAIRANRARTARRNGLEPQLENHCVHGHEFTPDNTYVNPRTGGRRCKACRNNSARTIRAEKGNAA